MPKKVYTWGKVKPGDIISFRYKGKKFKLSAKKMGYIHNL